MTGFPDHFSAVADAYRLFRPTYPPSLADWLALQSPRCELAWDCGCGSGQMSGLLADRFARVIATDASANQISQAPKRNEIEYRVARAEDSGIAADSVDMVVVAQAAHWFDLPAFYHEVRRVGGSGAILALICYGRSAIDNAIDPIVDEFYDQVAGPYWPAERAHIEVEYQDLPFPFVRLHAPRFEMVTRWTIETFLGYVQTWSAVQALLRKCGTGPVDEFQSRLLTAWRNGSTLRSVRFPMTVLAGRIHG